MNRSEENKNRALVLLEARKRSIEDISTGSLTVSQVGFKFTCQQFLEHGHSCANEIDEELLNSFGEHICKSCKSSCADFEYLTRQDVIAQYLIPEDSLQHMKFITRKNPRNSNWAEMKFFLRKHAKFRAVQRFGSEELLLAEVEKRQKCKFERDLQKTDVAMGSMTAIPKSKSAKKKELLQSMVAALRPKNSKSDLH